MPKQVRTFIAFDVAEPVRERLVALQDELRATGQDIKWVEPENLHLTLKFLGGVDETDLYTVCKTAEQAVAGLGPFDMELAQIGAFPNAQRPRVIWTGVGQGNRELTAIHQSLEKLYRAQGYPREDRSFTPHLTLGRARQPKPTPQLAAAIDRLADWQGGITLVREILVMSSQLSPDGPTYAVMGRARLTSQPT
jgi:2'-5' RNA ligase